GRKENTVPAIMLLFKTLPEQRRRQSGTEALAERYEGGISRARKLQFISLCTTDSAKFRR
ncbi:MAG: hypothetical protein IJV46_00520, partial [Acidaminococcaceae bacterium]|nr:hypothetical protein [Acidaminococcaceae bacterium]